MSRLSPPQNESFYRQAWNQLLHEMLVQWIQRMSLVSTLADLAAAMDSGEIYVNIHADAHPDGEIRAQIINTENPHPLLIQLSDNQPSLNNPPF